MPLGGARIGKKIEVERIVPLKRELELALSRERRKSCSLGVEVIRLKKENDMLKSALIRESYR